MIGFTLSQSVPPDDLREIFARSLLSLLWNPFTSDIRSSAKLIMLCFVYKKGKDSVDLQI